MQITATEQPQLDLARVASRPVAEVYAARSGPGGTLPIPAKKLSQVAGWCRTNVIGLAVPGHADTPVTISHPPHLILRPAHTTLPMMSTD